MNDLLNKIKDMSVKEVIEKLHLTDDELEKLINYGEHQYPGSKDCLGTRFPVIYEVHNCYKYKDRDEDGCFVEKSEDNIVAYFLSKVEADKYMKYQDHNLAQDSYVYANYIGYANKGDIEPLCRILLKLYLLMTNDDVDKYNDHF